jgi:single-stranded-DNA-specific exonuclease
MVKRWRICPHDPDRIAALERAAGIPPVVAQLLISRGICDPDVARQFLDPKLSALRDPDQLPGCTAAAERIHRAMRSKERIVIYGDYDVDGMTGTALLGQCIRMLGGNVGYYVPHRIDEGYGLHHEAIRSLASDKTELLVTVDCGIASVEEAATARECGLELIITDHHEPELPLPEAAGIVHPALPGHDYPFGGLSGSGVALKLGWAVCQQASGAKRVGERMKNALLQAVGLAALGTVADVVPLIDENRVLVRHGLTSLKERPTLGLATLIEIAGLSDKPHLDAEDVAFALAPRLNAAGRLGQAQLAVELLLTDRPDRARELGEYVDRLNSDRQTLERSIYLAAHKQAKQQFDPKNDPALVLAHHGWHPGVIGIVAGRLAEKYHAAAAGLTLQEGSLEAFRAAFCECAASEIPQEQRVAELTIDAEAPLSAFTLKVVEQMEQLAPFGQANARPLLCTGGVALAEPPRPIGSGGRHLSMRLKQHDVVLRAVAFGGGEWADDLSNQDRPLDVAFRPVINHFRGRRNVELHLVDWQPGR